MPNGAWFKPGGFSLERGIWTNAITRAPAQLGGTGLYRAVEANHGASEKLTALGGNPSSTVNFGDIGISNDFTLCSITRYSGSNRGRILDGRPNFLHGHHGGDVGVAHYNIWVTPGSGSSVDPRTNWCVMCGTSGYGLKIANGQDMTVPGQFGSGSPDLSIHLGALASQISDFEVVELMSWNYALSDANVRVAHDYLMGHLVTGDGGGTSLPYPSAWFKEGMSSLASWADAAGGKAATIGGSGASIVTASGNGATKTVTALRGNTATTVDFGDIVAEQFTLCSVTRYAGSNNMRILDGYSPYNFLHGHHNGDAGCAHYGQWVTNGGDQSPSDLNWVVMCSASGGPGHSLKLANGIDVGIYPMASEAPSGIGINVGAYASTQPSDFEIMELMAWNTALADADVIAASNYLMAKLGI